MIGRDPECDLPIQDERASWRHLRIQLVEGAPVLTDLGSTNGTYVDGVAIDSKPTHLSRDALVQSATQARAFGRGLDERSAAQGPFRRVPVGGRT